MFIRNTIASPPYGNECGNGYGQKPCVFLPAKPGMINFFVQLTILEKAFLILFF